MAQLGELQRTKHPNVDKIVYFHRRQTIGNKKHYFSACPQSLEPSVGLVLCCKSPLCLSRSSSRSLRPGFVTDLVSIMSPGRHTAGEEWRHFAINYFLISSSAFNKKPGPTIIFIFSRYSLCTHSVLSGTKN